MSILVRVLVVASILHLTLGFPTPNNRETFNTRRNSRQSVSTNYPQEQGSSRLTSTDSASLEASGFGSPEVFTDLHNKTRQSRLVAERKLRNVTSQFSNGTGGEIRLCNLEPSYLCLLEQPVQTQRDRDMRLWSIHDLVLTQVGRLNKAPPNYAKRTSPSDGMTGLNGEVPSSPFSGELQTFHASCDLPNKVGQEAWGMPGFFHLFFNVSAGAGNSQTQQEYFPTATGRHSKKPVNVISAKLRLYTLPTRANQIDVAKNQSDSANKTSDLADENILSSKNPSGSDEKIRVSVYWYTMPATRHHYKKKLLDTKMLTLRGAEYVDFDIQKAVKVWLDKKLNYGLSIEVENEDNDLVNAKEYFSNIACPVSTSTYVNLDQDNSSQSLDTITEPAIPLASTPSLALPILEICTLSVSNTVPYVDPTQQSAYPPFPFPVATRTYNPRNYRKESRIHSYPMESGNDEQFVWQNDGIPTDTATESHHRRRHHHGLSRHQKRNFVQPRTNLEGETETTTEFNFSEDHPLRSILSHPLRKSVQKSESGDLQKTIRKTIEDLETELESLEAEGVGKRNIVIENVFIEPQNSQRTR